MWKKSEQYKRVTYSHFWGRTWKLFVDPAEWSSAPKTESWDPANVWILQKFLAEQDKWNPRKEPFFQYYAPRFFVAQGGEIVTTASGSNAWGTISETLKTLVGA